MDLQCSGRQESLPTIRALRRPPIVGGTSAQRRDLFSRYWPLSAPKKRTAPGHSPFCGQAPRVVCAPELSYKPRPQIAGVNRMPSDILVNSLGLTYKSTIGMSIATLPDVCKTPSPAGPVPIPYPNFADQSSLDKGTKTVMAKGNMIAIKGSEYSMSTGDEPGTAGGVTSSTFKKETAWITYSFDVKMDGENACRHTDKMFHNHKNTVDLAGNQDPTAAGARA